MMMMSLTYDVDEMQLTTKSREVNEWVQFSTWLMRQSRRSFVSLAKLMSK